MRRWLRDQVDFYGWFTVLLSAVAAVELAWFLWFAFIYGQAFADR